MVAMYVVYIFYTLGILWVCFGYTLGIHVVYIFYTYRMCREGGGCGGRVRWLAGSPLSEQELGGEGEGGGSGRDGQRVGLEAEALAGVAGEDAEAAAYVGPGLPLFGEEGVGAVVAGHREQIVPSGGGDGLEIDGVPVPEGVHLVVYLVGVNQIEDVEVDGVVGAVDVLVGEHQLAVEVAADGDEGAYVGRGDAVVFGG